MLFHRAAVPGIATSLLWSVPSRSSGSFWRSRRRPRTCQKRARRLSMATFVLVHGAWHGSWCWKRVRKSLQAKGHEVYTPTLTGVAERSHLLTRDVSLETHILDIVNLIRWEETVRHSVMRPLITAVA